MMTPIRIHLVDPLDLKDSVLDRKDMEEVLQELHREPVRVMTLDEYRAHYARV